MKFGLDDKTEKLEVASTETGNRRQGKKTTFDYWPRGYVLPGNYRVIRCLGRGGMGTVYLVEYRYATDPNYYAVKTLNPEISQNPKRRRTFLRELRTWIDLPDYPHVVSCRFFRTMEDSLAVFAEYVDGGTLDQWIDRNQRTDIRNILDIAIQIAWGLNFAHEHDVIHQDVKSSNVLINTSGIAKLTDFGLARNRFSSREQPEQNKVVQALPVGSKSPHETSAISFGGMTLAYCSFEQAQAKKITRRTDIWSFGLLLLEMFNGGLSWRFGAAANQNLNTYLSNGPYRPMPPMPDSLVDLLRLCFQENPSDRWKNMTAVSEALISIYEEVTGSEYPREKPPLPYQSHVPRTARQRSTSDGASWIDPEEALRQALESVGSIAENADVFRQKPVRSKKGQILQDIEIFETIERIYQNLVKAGMTEYKVQLADTMMNKASAIEACHDYAQAANHYQGIVDLLEDSTGNDSKYLMAKSYMNLSACWNYMDRRESSLAAVDKSIELYSALLAEQFQSEIAVRLSNAYMNRGVVYLEEREFKKALPYMEKALALSEEILHKFNTDWIWQNLGFVCYNFSSTLQELDRKGQAMDMASQAMDIFQEHLERYNTYEIAFCLGACYINRITLFRRMGQFEQALQESNQALAYFEYQIQNENRNDMRFTKADALFHRAQIQFVMGNMKSAINDINNSESRMDEIVNRDGQINYTKNLAVICLNNAAMHYFVDEADAGRKKTEEAVSFWKEMLAEGDRKNTLQIFQNSCRGLLRDLSVAGDMDRGEKIQEYLDAISARLNPRR